MIRKNKLDLKYALLWIGVTVVFILLALIPQVIVLASAIIGIEVASNALFLIGIIFAYAILFSLTVALSRTSSKVKEIVQELGLLKNELENRRDSSNNEQTE